MTEPIPDWVNAIPSAPVHNLPTQAGAELTRPFTQQQLLEIGAEFIEQFLKNVVLAVVKVFIPGVGSFDQLSDWAENVPLLGEVLAIVEPIISSVQNIIDTIVSVLTDGGGIGNALTDLAQLLLTPLTVIQNMGESLADGLQDLLASLSNLDGRLKVIENPTDGTPGYDDCSTVGGFTNVVGTLESNGNSIRSGEFSAGYHVIVPSVDAHGVRFKLSRKQAGVVRVMVSADNALTNYAALEIRTGWFGDDYARVVVGTDPNVVLDLTRADGSHVQWDGYISSNWVWEIWYDPTDNTYRVTRNGNEVPELRWQDTGNLVSHGPSKRKVGVASNCLSINGPFPDNGFAVNDITILEK